MEPEIHSEAQGQQEVKAPVQNAGIANDTATVTTGTEENAIKEPSEIEKIKAEFEAKISQMDKRFETRFRREYAKRKEAEDRLNSLSQQDKPVNDLRMDDPRFKTPADYFAEVARQAAIVEVGKRDAEQQQNQERQRQNIDFEHSWAQRVQVAGIKDYVDRMTNSETDFDALQQQTPDVMLAIQESDVGVELAYHLGTHTEDAKKLLSMRDVNSRNRLLARIELGIVNDMKSNGAASNAAPVATGKAINKPSAPATATPAGSKAPVTDPAKMPMGQYAEWLLKQTKRRR